MPSFSEIILSLELDDKTKKLATCLLCLLSNDLKWHKIRKKHDKLRNLVTSTRRPGHRCDPSTLQNNRERAGQNGGKIMYMIRSSALRDIGDTPPDVSVSSKPDHPPGDPQGFARSHCPVGRVFA